MCPLPSWIARPETHKPSPNLGRLRAIMGEMEDVPMRELDFDALARELLAALLGKRSQTAWSRRLGYQSTVA